MSDESTLQGQLLQTKLKRQITLTAQKQNSIFLNLISRQTLCKINGSLQHPVHKSSTSSAYEPTKTSYPSQILLLLLEQYVIPLTIFGISSPPNSKYTSKSIFTFYIRLHGLSTQHTQLSITKDLYFFTTIYRHILLRI